MQSHNLNKARRELVATTSSMACINMFKADHQAGGGFCGAPPPMSPRISFSNDFSIEPPQPPPMSRSPADPNFEFSVGNHPMMAADQLFSKGRMLPLKERPQRQTTLRDELFANDEEERQAKGSIRWKELLGLKKPHCLVLSKKGERNNGATTVTDIADVHMFGVPSQDLRSHNMEGL